MNNSLKKTRLIFSLLLILSFAIGKSQTFFSVTVNNGSNTICLSGGTYSFTALVPSPVSGATSYSWTVFNTNSLCPMTYTNAVSNGSIVNVSVSCAGIPSIQCTAFNGTTVVGNGLGVFLLVYQTPTLNITPNQTICAGGSVSLSASGASNYTWSTGATVPSIAIAPTVSTCYVVSGTAGNACAGTATSCVTLVQTPTLSATPNQTICIGGSVNLIANGANTYTWSTGAPFPSIVIIPTVSTCYTVWGTNSFGCTGTATSCVTLSNTPLPVSPSSQTVCQGSSATFTASGASSYNWSAGSSTTSILNIIPIGNTTYSVFGTFSTNCLGTASVSVVVDTTCSNVWPGDANSDGVVNTSDVFEIGLAFSNTGPLRSPGGNSYTSQFANNWSGTVSTGKNKCHADCNGDGTVNNSDTLAIYNNYLLTHSFKSSESAVNVDISFSSPSTNVNEGMWSKVDILLGSSSSPLNQLYGVAFDVNFDQSLIETNSAYIVYTSSFLNASNQNVQFRKADFTNGKIYAASVRVNGSNVSGNGKIGEFWFKAKTGLPANSVLTISASNASRIDDSKVISTLSGGSASLSVVKNAVGINETNLEHNIHLFPNPASNVLTLQNAEKTLVSFKIIDIIGREMLSGEFSNSKTIDLSNYANGTYVIKLESEGTSIFKKLVVEK